MKNIVVGLLLIFISQTSVLGQSFEISNAANDKLISTYVEESKIPGLAIAIYHKDKPIWSKEYGYSNLEDEVFVSALSKFRIASVSKLFTGTAIYKLHKAGKLNLDDPISKYLDSIPVAWKEITIRQLAQHTSGIGHYTDLQDALDVNHYETTDDAIKKFKDRPLMHSPGRGVYYSSYAYTVLAAVIEKVTGKPYLTAMREIIFDPLQLNNVQADDQKEIIIGRTGFYQFGDSNRIENAPYIDLSGRRAGSGYLSTAEDLAKFGSAHTFSSSFLNRADLDLLTAPKRVNDSLETNEGLGWGRRTGYEGNTMYWGNGSTPGSTCGLLVFPKFDLSIAILSNIRGAPLERGEFQIIATRLIANIEGVKIKEVEKRDEGLYKLKIDMGGKSYDGELKLSLSKNSLGYFEFKGLQTFPIIDAFWKGEDLWVFAIGGGKKPIPLGMIPLRMKIQGENIHGDILRLSATLNGKKE